MIREFANNLSARLGREGRRVLLMTAVGAAAGLLYFAIAPRWFRSAATVVPSTPAKPAGGMQTALAALGSGVADLGADLGVGGDVERIAAVLQSRSVTDGVIAKHELQKRYRRSYIELARKDVWAHCDVSIERKARMVSIGCEDEDPQFAKSMVETFVDLGKQAIRRVGTSAETEEVRFLIKRTAEAEREADEAAQELRQFEERNKIIDIESQSKAIVGSLATLRSQRISKELELSYSRSFSSREEATTAQLEQQLSILSSKYRSLDDLPAASEVAPRKTSPGAAELFPPAMSLPRLEYELAQLIRERKIRETNLIALRHRLEMARVNEARDTSAFQVLDAPALPTYKHRPRGSVAMAVGLLLGALVGAAWAWGPRYLRLVLADPR
jgi:capsule polysaccharide export protein KpsE/RkpR